MLKIHSLVDCFVSGDFVNVIKRETVAEFELSGEIEHQNLINCITKIYEVFSECLTYELSLEIRIDNEVYTFYSKHMVNFYSSFDELQSYASPEDVLNVKLFYIKDCQDGNIIILDVQSFIDWLNNLKLVEQLETFNDLISKNSLISFISPDFIEEFATNSFCFKPIIASSDIEILDRNVKMTKRNQVANIQFFSNFILMPEDFDFNINTERVPLTIQSIFNNIKNIISICYLFDYSHLNGSDMELVMYTPNLITFKTNTINDYSIPSSSYAFRIYEWTYDSGNIIDKSGIAKSVICSDFNKQTFETLLLSIDENVYNDIQSNFKLYLIENLDNYLRLKHEAADKLNILFESIISIRNTVYDRFAQSLLAILIFFITVYITSIASEGVNILSYQMATTFYIGLLVSLGHSILSLIISMVNLSNIEDNSDSLKNLYSDVLIDTNKENTYLLNKKLKKVRKTIWISWTVIVVIILIVAMILNNFSDSIILKCLDFVK